MTARIPSTWRYWLLIAILLLAFGLRLQRLGADSLWYDETVTVHLAGRSVPALVAHTARDIHPPGYYLLLHGWARLAGLSEFSAAFLSLLFGVLLVALAYRLGRAVFGVRAGLLAALLVALSPFNLWYSQEVRMYTLGAVLGMALLILVAGLLGELGESRGDPPSWRRLLAYALCGAAGLWVLYYFAFLLVAVNLMVIAWWFCNWRYQRLGSRWLLRWALAQGLLLLLYTPWLPAAWRQATSPPVPPWRSFVPLARVLLEWWTALGLGQSADPRWAWPPLILTAVLFILGLVYGTRRRPGPVDVHRTPNTAARRAEPVMALFLAGYVVLPILIIYLVSFLSPLYHVRYAFIYSTPLYIIIGAGLAVLWRWWKPAMWLALAAMLVFSAVSISAYYSDPRFAADDHRGATEFLSEHWRPGDAILVNAGYAYTAPEFYWSGDPIYWRGRLVGEWSQGAGPGTATGPVLIEAGTVGGNPSLGWGDPQSDFYAMSETATAEALARLFDDFDRVWVYRIYDTVTDPEGFIRRWLDDNALQFEDQVFGGEAQLRVQGFVRDVESEPVPPVPIDASLSDGSLRLLGTEVWPKAVEAGAALDLAPFWRVETQPTADLRLFAGLFDEGGRRWAQTDERPLGSLFPVGDWPRDAVVRTPLQVSVPATTPPGTYRLELGWYRFENGQPVWAPWPGGERLLLGAVEVVPPQDGGGIPRAPAPVAHSVDIAIGPGVRFVGYDAHSLQAHPGARLELDLVWQAEQDAPAPGLAVLQLRDAAGSVVSENQSAPVNGAAPFTELAAGQAVRDPRSLPIPADLPAGVYVVHLGRRAAGGAWLPIRRGLAPLGSTYPLASIRVVDRTPDYAAPRVQHPVRGRFGDAIGFVGFDALPEAMSQPHSTGPWTGLELTLYWQALGSIQDSYKLFLHLVSEADPSSIDAQSDAYPSLPTTAWLQGEYLSDVIHLDLPDELAPGTYTLRLGFYDEPTGARLPATDDEGRFQEGGLVLGQVRLGK